MTLNTHLEPARITRVVALMSSSRSGTSLMSSLLDFHPHILSIPDNYLWAFSDFWDEHGGLPAADVVTAFVSHYHGLIFDASVAQPSTGLPDWAGSDLGLTTLGENRDQALSADPAVFRATMLRLLPADETVTRRLFFQAMHIAYADAVGRKVAANPIILYGLHIAHPHRVRKFVDDFPNALFLHMIRDPMQSTASQFRQFDLINTTIGATMVGLVQSIIGSVPLVADARARTRIVRLEDVHADGKRVMINVCAWLGIPFNESALRSTYNGLKFWNEKGQPQVSGISTDYIKPRHEEYTSAFDNFRIRALCARRHFVLGYYRDSFLLRRRAIQILLAPLLLWPLRTERIEIAHALRQGKIRDVIRTYLQMRMFFLKYLLVPPPHGIPLFGEHNW